MARIGFKKNINVGRVVSKVASTILALYVGGLVITEFGNVMVCTSSPFYRGLGLIGWTVSQSQVVNASLGSTTTCNSTTPLNGITAGTWNNSSDIYVFSIA